MAKARKDRPASRARHQLTIALGDGQRGVEVRRRIDAAAERAGMKPSVWCKQVVLEKAGLPPEGFVTRAEFDRLVARVEVLEGPTVA